MHKQDTTNTGFTLVELLIVIVVIAILATISIIAYSGIQGRAINVAVISDLAQLKKKIEFHKVDNDDLYPAGYVSGGPELSTLGFKMTKGVYATLPTTENNFIYSRNSERDIYCVVALSKSGNIYYITNRDSPTEYKGSVEWDGSVGASSFCAKINGALAWPIAGYASSDTTTGPYRDWVGGN